MCVFLSSSTSSDIAPAKRQCGEMFNSEGNKKDEDEKPRRIFDIRSSKIGLELDAPTYLLVLIKDSSMVAISAGREGRELPAAHCRVPRRIGRFDSNPTHHQREVDILV